MSDIKIIVAGAAGRMGRTLVRQISQTPGCVLAGALAAPWADIPARYRPIAGDIAICPA